MSSPVRRSSRARRQATTIYDEAAEIVQEQRKKIEEKADRDDDDDGDDETNSGDEDRSADNSSEDSSDSDDDDSDEDASVVAKIPSPKKKTKKTVTPNKRSPAVVKRGNTKAAYSRTSSAPGSRRSTTTATVATRTAFTKARITQALKLLSKSVLNNHNGSDGDDNDDEMDEEAKDETPGNSLVAALLASAKPVPGITSTTRPKTYYYQQQRGQADSLSAREKRTNTIITICLPQLDGIVRHLIQTTEHEGPHALHSRLLNLFFRSVGGSTRTNIPEDTDLDELEDDDWDELISKVVTVMKNESDADQTLLIADDDGDDDDDDEFGAGSLTTRQIGIVVYRTLYKEFWYRLGHVLLAHSPSPAVAMVSEEEEEEDDNENDNNDSDSDSDDKDTDNSDSDSDTPRRRKRNKRSKKRPKKKKKSSPQQAPQGFSSNRFQLEKVRDLILRMTELVSVGQPDLRAAGTLAVLQLARACVERTVELEQKIKVALRQLKIASKAKSKRKHQALQHHLDNWKRHKAELEEIVEGPVFQGVFIHRYRDRNDRIRRDCLRTLSAISLIRPDIFLVDTYLKYFGWMASDKAPCVRVAALEGLLAPFRVVASSPKPTKQAPMQASTMGASPFPIEIQSMHNVVMKFLPRIVDCIDDAHSLRVQELAMKMLLRMLREEFLDEWEEDGGWDKVNLKALDIMSSPRLRRDALYFVMDQLDAFDTDGKKASSISERKQLDQLVAIARWSANKLCDGSIPIDKMNIELIDCLVRSLLEMPDHKELVLNWSMMLKAIRSENPQQGSANDREEIATQRILLRILATSAKLELGKASEIEKPKPAVVRKRKRSSDLDTETSLDQLSTALLKNLPHLLDVFRSDVMSLRDVTRLPSTITSSVLSLPSRKTDFQNVVKTLCQLYLDSTDEQILQNIARTLSQWVEDDHTRVSEVKVNLKRLSSMLQDRLMELFRESDPQEEAASASPKSTKSSASRRSRGNRRSPRKADADSTIASSGVFSASPEVDAEHSISLMMLRWSTLLMQCHAKHLFEKADGEDEDEIEGLFFTISEAMGKRLSDRMPIQDRQTDDNDTATALTTPAIWKEHDPEVHEVVSTTIRRALRVMLFIVSYELSDTLTERKEFENNASNSEKNQSEDLEIDEYNYPVLKLRDNLVKLLGLCFDQHLPDAEEEVEYTNEQHEFADSVQVVAGQVSSDLRTLFPFDWSRAADPVRRALALTNGEDFTFLLSGFARWFQSREASAEENDDEEAASRTLVREALLPLARVTTMNFDGFFRKEAAMVMQHISGSGSLASQTILSLSRTLKKTNPVRMLESHMACLRLAFENWLDSEPEVPEDTSPTDEEIQAFEDAEKRHVKAFASMEHVSSKLSSTLGVAGRLANESLKKSIYGFMREGIRYSFDGASINQKEDDLVVGSRLAFLLILSKYSIWIKKEKGHMDQLSDFLIEKEYELRRHPEFEEVHEDDLKALADLKKTLGIKRVADNSLSIENETTVADDRSFSVVATPSPSTAASGGSSHRGTMSTLSMGSRTSRRSGMSAQSELSPLYEEDDAEINNGDDEDEDSDPTPQKRRRLDASSSHRADNSSVGSNITKGTRTTLPRGTIPEETEQDESESGRDSEES